MKKVLVGHDNITGLPIHIPVDALDTHVHLMGQTGSGKTTLIHTLLHGYWRNPFAKDCWIIIDRMGGLSFDLLLWMTSPYCPSFVKDRLVYVEPANESVVMGFNPLVYQSAQHGYYKVGRATDCILRAWQSQDITQMPRLARWVFNAFWAAAQLGLTVSDCGHIFNPASPFHRPILEALPFMLRAEWSDILRAGGRATEILDSSRNRLKPYFEAPVLRNMFGTAHNHLDIARFMREGKILILNLANENRIGPQIADAIGGLVINEVLATARGNKIWERTPTYLLLDEFQRFVGPDLEEALPEVRQMQIKLLLSHQSLSQLKRGDLDMTTMIFQAQSRALFGMQGDDADMIAHELASFEFDPMKIKDETWVRRQRQIGHRIVTLSSWGNSATDAKSWGDTWGENWGRNETKRLRPDYSEEVSRGTNSGGNRGESSGGSQAYGTNQGTHESLVPNIEDYLELASRTYSTFEEDRQVWARNLRKRRRGNAFLRIVDELTIRDLAVKRSAPGYLKFNPSQLYHMMPETIEDVEKLKEEIYRSGDFLTPNQVERETRERLQQVLRPPIVVQGNVVEADPAEVQPVDDGFCD